MFKYWGRDSVGGVPWGGTSGQSAPSDLRIARKIASLGSWPLLLAPPDVGGEKGNGGVERHSLLHRDGNRAACNDTVGVVGLGVLTAGDVARCEEGEHFIWEIVVVLLELLDVRVLFVDDDGEVVSRLSWHASQHKRNSLVLLPFPV